MGWKCTGYVLSELHQFSQNIEGLLWGWKNKTWHRLVWVTLMHSIPRYSVPVLNIKYIFIHIF